MIKDKTICLLLPGPSIQELHSVMPIENVLFASLNRFSFIENDFLKPYNKKMDLVWCSSFPRFEEQEENIIQFINNGGTFYTSHELFLTYLPTMGICRNQIILSSEGIGLCSLFCFLAKLISQEPKKIILVGADGHSHSNKVYYNDSNLENENLQERRLTILRDTKIWYPPSKTEIVKTNCNSCYDIFEYQSLKEAIK